MLAIPNDSRRIHTIPGVRHQTLAGKADGFKSLEVWMQTKDPGAATPPHYHECEEVVVVHSMYWRSAHWTCEFSYSFEIDPTPAVKAQLFENNLRQLTPEEVAKEKERTGLADAPWFAPKDASAYDGWVYGDLPRSEFKMFLDRETGHIFLNDIQM